MQGAAIELSFVTPLSHLSLLEPARECSSYGDSRGSREWVRNSQLLLRPRLRTGTVQLLTY